ncbi:MAG: hypothetical protein N3E51_00505 [Candidatus Micrarchaeota archaeon]|nr:hypothetical protein [Candidatus Micrarchaeota archaeon]
MVDEFDSAYYPRNMLCIPCWTRKSSEVHMVGCSRCGTRLRAEEAKHKAGRLLCNYCFTELERIERLPICPLCKKPLQPYEKQIRLSSGLLAHSACALSKKGEAKVFCSSCGQETEHFRIFGGFPLCAKCERQQKPATQGSLLASLLDRVGAMLG